MNHVEKLERARRVVASMAAPSLPAGSATTWPGTERTSGTWD